MIFLAAAPKSPMSALCLRLQYEGPQSTRRVLFHAIPVQASIHLSNHRVNVKLDTEECSQFFRNCLRLAKYTMIMQPQNLNIRFCREPSVDLDQVALEGFFDSGTTGRSFEVAAAS